MPMLSAWLLLGTLFAPPPAHAIPGLGCTQDGSVCVQAIERPEKEEVEYWVENKVPGRVTLSLELGGRQLASALAPRAPVGPITAVVDKFGRKLVATIRSLKKADPHGLAFQFVTRRGDKDAVHDDQYAYAVPFERGRQVRISQAYHGRASHSGPDEFATDFEVAEGTPVYAAREGVVVEVVQDFSTGGPSLELEDKANAVRIEHADHTIGEYAHLKYRGSLVRLGQRVQKGDLIGYSGNTGKSTGPHLHFAVYQAIDGRNRRSLPIRFDFGDSSPRAPEQGLLVKRP